MACAASALALSAGAAWADDAAGLPDLKRMSLEDLSSLEISSVSRTPEPVSRAPAAIYVITGEDVRRSGSTTLAEVLRLAPNLHVGRIDAGSYAISARGFNSSVSNKLLVLIDGRTVYTPLYSGVFWDMQNMPPSDIARIEVVSGPGGALWGSNAVNGVINVVSRDAHETQGGMVRVSGGSSDWSGAAQYSGLLGGSGAYRIYGQASHQGHSLTASGASGLDRWRHYQMGGRADWALDQGALTIQGDIYDGYDDVSAASVTQPGAHIGLKGANVLARWKQATGEDSDLEVQGYYDTTARKIRNGIHDRIEAFDLAVQERVAFGERNTLVFGGGYRVTTDELIPVTRSSFLVPGERTLRLSNVFAHDTIALTEKLRLAAGLKLEHNSYTGWEVMPDARLTYQITPGAVLWAAVSRAMRTPSRFDRDLFNTGILAGGPNFRSEELIAYEVGTRALMAENVTASVSVYYNDYDHIRTVEPPFPLMVSNLMDAKTYGLEAWASYEPLPWWRLKGGLTLQHEKLRLKPGSRSFFGTQQEGNDPKHQASLRSEMNLTETVEFDAAVRVVGALPNPRVPAYAAVDARLGWNISEAVQLSLAGYNLTNAAHTEFVVSTPPRRDVRRSVYATARWSF